MGLVGSLWNQDLRARLKRLHERVARQAISGERPVRRPPPMFQRQRVGQLRGAIVAVLAEHNDGLRIRDIATAVAAQLGEPVSRSSVKSCLCREARNVSGAFERIGRGRYRLR